MPHISRFLVGEQVKADQDLRQLGWSAKVPAGTVGTVTAVSVERTPVGSMTYYSVAWSTGVERVVTNGHLLLSAVTP